MAVAGARIFTFAYPQLYPLAVEIKPSGGHTSIGRPLIVPGLPVMMGG